MTDVFLRVVAVILTLFVLSRILGDNPLFRIAQYLFVGVALGYAFVVLYHQVLWPAVAQLTMGDAAELPVSLRLVPFVLGVLLIPRITGRQSLSWLSNIPLAVLFGVGAALALGGVIVGTIRLQLIDTVRPLGGDLMEIIGAVLLVIGVILTLSYFYFTVPRDTGSGRVVAAGAQLGRWVLIVAFGFFFAGALRTYLIALIERLNFLINW